MLRRCLIIVITIKEKNPRTGREELIASHGVDAVTGKNVILSCEHPEKLGAVYDDEIGEYVIRDP
jgi:hypothetical protein